MVEPPAPNLVSVIIPTYNRAPLVREAVESVLAQTYSNVEIIVVDDGSSDDTAAILEPLADRVAYLSQQNKGRSAARNRGLSLAHGEYVLFLDSDDLLLPAAVETQLGYLQHHREVDVIFGDASFLTDDGALHPMESCSSRLQNGDVQSFLSSLLHKNRFALHTAMARRAVLESDPFDERLRALEDWDLWLRLALDGHVLRCHPEPVAIYRRHAGNTDVAAPHRLVKASVRICTKIVAQDLDARLPARMRQDFRLDHLDAITLSASPRIIRKAVETILRPEGTVSSYGLRRLPLCLVRLVPRGFQVAVRVLAARFKPRRSSVFFRSP